MLKDKTNSKSQGNVGIGSAIGIFTELGYIVSVPLTDSQDYDLLIDINGSIKRVQVKTTYRMLKQNNYEVSLRVKGGNRYNENVKHFDKNKVDFLFVITEDKVRYLIPTSDIDNKSSLTLYNKYDKYKI